MERKGQKEEIDKAKKLLDKFSDILEAEHATNYIAVLTACSIIIDATKEHRKKVSDIDFLEYLLYTIYKIVE